MTTSVKIPMGNESYESKDRKYNGQNENAKNVP
jgi:hypothetical protein